MITASDIAAALREAGVEDDDTVIVHAGMQAALRVHGDSAEQKLETVLDGFDRAVPGGRLIMPTFTYSFCEDRLFDLARSPSTVGALGERFRHAPGVRRTADPIFSCAIRGELPERWTELLYEVRDTDCFGPESVFAYLLEARAQLVCFGVGFGYVTFVHHIEQRLGVPYRYFKEFRGTIRDGTRKLETTARYFVHDLEPGLESCFAPLGDALVDRGIARRVSLSQGPSILAARADAVESEVERRLADEPAFLIRRGHETQAKAPSSP